MIPDPPWNRPTSRKLTRRRFLGTVGAGSAAFALPWLASRTGSLSPRQRDLVVAVAQVATVFPVRTHPGVARAAAARTAARTPSASPALRRAFMSVPDRFPVATSSTDPTAAVVAAAARQLTTRQLALAGAGANALLADGLPGQGQARLLERMAARAGSAEGQAQMSAVATLAIAARSGQPSGACENLATSWVSVLHRMGERGALSHVAALRGIR